MRKTLSLVLLVLVLSSCRSQAVRDVWHYIQDRPDSALCVLNSMEEARLHGRSLAEYRLLKAMAMDKNYIDVASDSLARPSYKFFHRHGPLEMEMLSLYYLGMSQYYAKDSQKAIVSLDEASALAADCGNLRYEAYSQIYLSHLFYADRNYEDAIKTARHSIDCFSFLPDSTYHIQMAKVQLAECLLAQRRYQEAQDLLSPILSQHPNDTAFQRKALPLYAWVSYLSDNDRAPEALELLKRAVSIYGAQLNPYQYHHYGQLLLSVGDIAGASVVQKALEQYPEYEELGKSLHYKLLKEAGNYPEALAEYESLLDRQNDLALQTMSQALVRVQRDYQAMARDTAVQEARDAKDKMLLLLIVLVLILLLGGVVIYHRQKALEEAKEQMMASAEEARQIIQNATNRNKELEGELETARLRYISAYKKQFQKIASLVEYYRETSGRKDGRDLVYKQVMELSSAVGMDRQSMRALERSVNVALDNALQFYKEDYPGKDQAHYDLVCYLMAGLPASLIEMLTGIPRNTIYSKKKRLLEEIASGDKPHRILLMAAIK